jgi:hypothetical protein
MHAPAASGLEVNTTFFPLSWVFALLKPVVEVNGHPYTVPWGIQFAPLPPGRYHVRVFVPYLFGPACMAQSDVEIHPGHVTRMLYETGFSIFGGSLRCLDVRPMG